MATDAITSHLQACPKTTKLSIKFRIVFFDPEIVLSCTIVLESFFILCPDLYLPAMTTYLYYWPLCLSHCLDALPYTPVFYPLPIFIWGSYD